MAGASAVFCSASDNYRFFIKRKDFPGEEAKTCIQCGGVYLKEAVQCSKCGIDLPEVNVEERKKQKKLGRIFGAAIIAAFVAAVVVGTIFGFAFSEDIIDDELFDENFRIAVNGVYYDAFEASRNEKGELITAGNDPAK